MGNVVITGGSRGIGAATVELFAARGDRVTFLYEKNHTAAKAVADKTGAAAICCDVADGEAVNRAFSQIGDVDILVCNAGTMYFGLLSQMAEDEWNRLFAVNVGGIYHCVNAAMPSFLKTHRGSIVTVASMWGQVGASCEAAYSATKGAVIALTKALAKELRICEQRVTAAFKKLVELKLVWEKRCGRGDANQIYLARVTPIEDPDYSCAPFITEDESEVRGSRTSDLEGLADGKPSAACQEPQNLLSKNREDRASRTAKSAFPEPQKLTPSKKEKRKIDQSHMEVRPSVRALAQDGRTDGDAEEELLDILDGCELECFAPETALVFENAIERLFYADSFRIGNATLPQSRVRAKLRRLDGLILREAESKLRANQERNVKNSTAYTMAVLFNCIAESESDLMIDPYLNAICAAV